MNDIVKPLGQQAGAEIDYDDAETLRALLVGQRVVAITETTGQELYDRNEIAGYHYGGRGEYDRVLEYHLAGGVVLRAHAHDGGCACSNGCFSVGIPDADRERIIGATIMSITIEERVNDYYSDDPDGQLIVDGAGSRPHDGDSTIKVFAYLPGLSERTVLVESSGGDNGYYGWGFHFSVGHPLLVIGESEPRRQISEGSR